MKKLKCKSCSEEWYINNDKLNYQKCCPYCSAEIKKEVKFDKIDSLDKVIYLTVQKFGIDMLKTPVEFANCMADIAPNLQKETRLISKFITDEYAKDIFTAFSDNSQNTDDIFKNLKKTLTDEEFIAEKWADLICSNFKSAVMLYKGKNLPVVMSVDVSDVSDISEETETQTLKEEQPKEKAYSQSEIIDSGKCGDNAEWTLYRNGTLIISGSGEMYNYEFDNNHVVNNEWYKYKDTIKKVEIKNGITTIGQCAFFQCESITNVNIPNSINSINFWAFFGCISLANITIPDSVICIASFAFRLCSNLININIPYSIAHIGFGAFSGCSSLTNVNIPNITTYIGGRAFADCSSLKEIRIPKNARKNTPNWEEDWKEYCNAEIVYI